jgi:hypothetical protein
LIGKPERKCPKEKLGLDAKTVLRYIERNRMSRVWAEFICVCVRIWKTGSCCEHGNEPLRSMKWEEGLETLFPEVSS